MDAKRIRAIRERGQDALRDLPPAGMVGLAAVSSCHQVLERLEKLDAANAQETLEALRAVSEDLAKIDSALGLHPDALAAVVGRCRTIAEALLVELSRP